jgi:hypothetical protein
MVPGNELRTVTGLWSCEVDVPPSTSFTDEETEVQRGKVTYPRSHNLGSGSDRLTQGILTPDALLSTSATLLCRHNLTFEIISQMGLELGLGLRLEKLAVPDPDLS